MIKNKVWLAVALCTHAFLAAVSSTKKGPMKMGVVVTSTNTQNLHLFVTTIQKDLNFTGQLELFILPAVKKIGSALTSAKKAGYPLLLEVYEGKNTINLRLYSTKSGIKKFETLVDKKTKNVLNWAHWAADLLMPALTNQKSSFLTKIVYCKEPIKGKKKTQICICDVNGSNKRVVADLDSIALSPCWASVFSEPTLFYSQYTLTNLQLIKSDLKGNSHIATDFDGLNMQPCFSEDGSYAIVCLSVNGSSQLYRYQYNPRKKQSEYKQITDNNGINLSPIILPDSSIVFCSDFQNKGPQIYKMDQDGTNIEQLSTAGSSTSPSYCKAKNSIVYTKMIKGVSQIMVYDIKTKKNTQLTHDLWHKQNPSCSPCGNYIVYCLSDAKTKRLAVHNCLTQKRKIITSSDAHYSAPSWSHIF